MNRLASQHTLLAPPLTSSIDTTGESFLKNRDDMLEQLAEIDELLDAADMGGGERSRARLRSRAKMPIRERIAHVLDPDTPFLEISPLAAYKSDYAMGGGLVAGIGIIAGTECVVMGNDPTAMAGAMIPARITRPSASRIRETSTRRPTSQRTRVAPTSGSITLAKLAIATTSAPASR